MRLIHTADVHLDAPFAYLPHEKRKLKREALRKAFTRVVDLTLEKQALALVIAGDLFNSPDPSTDTVAFVVGELGRLAGGAQVFIVPGNHDCYQPGGLWDSPDWPAHVHIFKADSWATVATTGGALIAGIACHRTGSERSVLKDLRAEGVTVAVMHGAHQLDFYEGRQSYPFSETEAANIAVKYLALGHYHNFTRIGKSPAFYSGTPEGLCFEETGPRSALVVDLDEGAAKVTAAPVGRFKYQRHVLDCTSYGSAADIEGALAGLAGPEDIMKVELVGAPPVDVDIDVDSLLLRMAEHCFYIDIKDRLDLPASAQDAGRETTVRSKFLARMEAKSAEADSGEAKRVIALATRLGLAALEGRLQK